VCVCACVYVHMYVSSTAVSNKDYFYYCTRCTSIMTLAFLSLFVCFFKVMLYLSLVYIIQKKYIQLQVV